MSGDRELAARAQDAAAAGLRFLAASQLPSGALPSAKWRCVDGAITDVVAEDAVFPTALMAVALLGVPGADAQEIRERATAFLEHQMEPGGVWRYLTRGDPFADSLAPDVDDTALASLLLRCAGRSVPANEPLLLSNRDREGRFFTWITIRGRWWPRPERWRILARRLPHARRMWQYYTTSAARTGDIDAGVNANVLLYLGGSEATQPVAERLLALVRDDRASFADRWYSDPLTVWYLASRALRPIAPEGRRAFLARANGARPGTALQHAHVICVLLDWEQRPPDEHVEAILDAQQADGSWAAFAVYTAREEQWGGPATTTALCVEALSRWAIPRAGI